MTRDTRDHRARRRAPIGVDEWVARSGERRRQGRGWRQRARARRRPRRLVAAARAGRARRARLRPARRPTSTSRPSRSTACSTRSSRSGSTSPSAGRACSTSATSRSSASAPTATRSSPRTRSGPSARPAAPAAGDRVDPDRRRGRGGIVGVLIGLIALRLSGDYLAIVTLFVGQAFVEVVNNVDPGHARRRQRPVRPGPVPQLRRSRSRRRSATTTWR